MKKIKLVRYLATVLIIIQVIVQVIVIIYYPFNLLYVRNENELFQYMGNRSQTFLLQSTMNVTILALSFLMSYYERRILNKKGKFTKKDYIQIAIIMVYLMLSCVLIYNAPYLINYATILTVIGVYGIYRLY